MRWYPADDWSASLGMFAYLAAGTEDDMWSFHYMHLFKLNAQISGLTIWRQ